MAFRVLMIALFGILLVGCPYNQPRTGGSEANRIYGEASWYGGKFHGRTTASGEVYDKNGITAAHATLGFGTKVRVTNRENGRSVVVRINDRFPGTKGRIIDLSEGAFRQIAPTARGVIPVELVVMN